MWAGVNFRKSSKGFHREVAGATADDVFKYGIAILLQLRRETYFVT